VSNFDQLIKNMNRDPLRHASQGKFHWHRILKHKVAFNLVHSRHPNMLSHRRQMF